MDYRLDLSNSTFTILRDLIRERIGLHYDESKRDLLADRLAPLVAERGLQSFLDYYYFLKYDPEAEQEWLRVMDALSVQETYFWREVDQIEALVKHIAPARLARSPRQPLRIWSAGCATGEEPYSIAIALTEADLYRQGRIEILGTDASPAAIAHARRAVYRERSFRALPATLRARYFTPTPEGERLDDRIRKRVVFRVLNLLDEKAMSSIRFMDVIFCRNVFIYFTPETVARVAAAFHRILRDDGVLFLGAAESLLRITTDFELVEIGDAFAYVKR